MKNHISNLLNLANALYIDTDLVDEYLDQSREYGVDLESHTEAEIMVDFATYIAKAHGVRARTQQERDDIAREIREQA